MADIDPEVLRQLNENLQDLSRDLSQLGNDRIVAALGQLTVELTRRRRDEAKEAQFVQQFAQKVDNATRAMSNQAQSAQASAQAQQELQGAANQLNRTLRDLASERGSLLTDSQRRARDEQDIAESRLKSDFQYLRSLGTASGMLKSFGSGLSGTKFKVFQVGLILGGEALEGLKKTAGALGNALGGIITAGFATAAALAKGENSATVFNGMIDASARALADLGKSIPLFGAAMGAIAGVGKFLLEALQMVTESMNTVGRSGVLGAGGMDAFVAQAGQAGLSLKQMEKVTTENANVLARFGGTVADGAARFATITGDVINTELGRELRFLGFNREQIAEATAGFLNQQIRLGAARGKTDAQLTAGAARYAKELDLLAKLTGQTREEVQKQQDAALSESRFRAALDGMDETTAKRFLDFQNVLNKAAPEMAQGFRDITSGFPTTAAAQEFLRLGGQQIVDSIMSGTGSADAFRQLQGLIGPQVESARGLALAVGDDVRVIGKYTELRDVLNAEIIDGDIKLRDQQKEQTQSAGALTQSIVSAQETLDLLQVRMQQLALSLVPKATGAVEFFAEKLEWGTQKILNILGLGGEQGSIWKIVGTVAGATIGKMLGNVIGGLIGMVGGGIVGFLTGGPVGALLGAAAGAGLGSTAGGGFGAILGALAGYAGGDAMDKGASFGDVAGAFMDSLKPEFMRNTPQPGREERRGRARRSVDQPGGGRDPHAQLPVPSPRPGPRDTPSQQPVPGPRDTPSRTDVTPENLFVFQGGLTGRQENFDNLDPGFQTRLMQMALEYRQATGKRLPLSSGARSREDNAAVGGAGTSRHLRGLAVDLSADSVNELKRMGLLNSYGFKQNNRSAWHISDDGFRKGGIASGPESGYHALLHGREAVVPLPDGKTIPVDIRMPEIRNMFADMDFSRDDSEITGMIDRMTQNIQRSMEDLVRRVSMNPAMESALDELVSLQRSNNSTTERLLQVSVN